MSVELEALQAAVAENTSIDQSAIQLIQGLAEQLEAAAEDPEKIRQLTAEIMAQSAAMSAAIAANTSSAPEPEPETPVDSPTEDAPPA